MSKVRSPKRIASALAVSVLLSLSLAGGAYADSATDIAPGALTTPPPVEMNLNSSISLLANKYLINYYSTISKVSGTQVSINGFTGAGQAVDSIGINYVLQRWTGSAWVDAGSAYENGTNKLSLAAPKISTSRQATITAAKPFIGSMRTVHMRKGLIIRIRY